MVRIDLGDKVRTSVSSEVGPSGERPKKRLEVTPTLVIGLGGTGTKILSVFKQSIRSVLPPEAPVSFLGIDTSREDLPGAPLEADEFALCECLQAPRVIKNLNNFPDIAEWWFDDVSDVGAIQQGAQMKRFVGRLACFFNFRDQIRWRLENQTKKLERLFEPAKKRHFSVRSGSLRVYVIGSLSGGTGGGFFFDIALAVREAVTMWVGSNIMPLVVGVIVLPRGFMKEVPMHFMRQKIQANFYAGMKEIEYLSTHYEEFKFKLSGFPITVEKAPFDTIYLLDTLNQAGRNIESIKNLFSMIASELCMEVYSSMTKQVEATLNNVQDEVAKVSSGRKCFYGSFGTAGLIIPTSKLLDYCVLTYTREFLTSSLLQSSGTEGDPDATAVRILNELGILKASQEKLSETFRQEGTKGMNTQVRDLPKDKAKQAMQIAAGESKKMDDKRRGLRAAENNIEKIATGQEGNLAAKLDRIFDNLLTGGQACGLEYAVSVARRFYDRLLQLRDTVAAREGRLGNLRELQEQAGRTYETTMRSQRAKGLFSKLSRSGQANTYEDFRVAYNRYSKALLDSSSLAGAHRCYDALLRHVSSIKDSLKLISSSVSRVCQTLHGHAEKRRYAEEEGSGEGGYILVESVIGPEHFPELYKEMKKDVHPRIDKIILRPPKGGLAGLKAVYLVDIEDLLNDQIFPCVEEAFRNPIEGLDILDQIEHWTSFSVQQWVRRAIKQCKPFCNFDPVKVPGGYFKATYIGVPDSGSNRYRKAVGNIGATKLVSTGNYNEIRIYSLMTALPAHAVSGIDRYRQVYQEYCSLAKKDPQLHVHIDRRWTDINALPDLFPQGG